MYRVTSSVVVWILVLIVLVSGCGESGTMSGKSTLTIAFRNKWGGTLSPSGDYRTHVIIPESGHDFYMEPQEFRVIEVTPKEGASTVRVRIERKAGRPDLADIVREVEVGGGKTVTITDQFQVDITDS